MGIEIRLDHKALQSLIESLSEEQSIELQRNIVSNVVKKTLFKDLHKSGLQSFIQEEVRSQLLEHKKSLAAYIKIVFEEESKIFNENAEKMITNSLKKNVVSSVSGIINDETGENTIVDRVLKRVLLKNSFFEEQTIDDINTRTKKIRKLLNDQRQEIEQTVNELKDIIKNSESQLTDLTIRQLSKK